MTYFFPLHDYKKEVPAIRKNYDSLGDIQRYFAPGDIDNDHN